MLTGTVLQAREKRGQLFEQMKKINDEAKGKELTGDQRSKWDAMSKELDSLKVDIDAEEERGKMAKRLQELEAEMSAPIVNSPDLRIDPSMVANLRKALTPEMRAAASKFFRGVRLDEKDNKSLYDQRTVEGLSPELRALTAGSDTSGGYLITPQELAKEIIKAADAVTLFKGLTQSFPVANSASLGVPTLDTDVDDADWTPEASFGNESDIKFGKRQA